GQAGRRRGWQRRVLVCYRIFGTSWAGNYQSRLTANHREFLNSFVPPRCSLCLCGESYSPITHHRVTEDTEEAQRFSDQTVQNYRFALHMLERCSIVAAI